MLTLRIEEPFDKNEFIEVNNIKWKIYSMKTKKTILSFLLFASLILGVGIFANYDNEPNNPAVLFGTVLELFAILMVYIFFLSKRKYRNKMNELAEKFETVKMDCAYEFSDDSIKYWDKEKHYDLKWEVFSSYSIYKDYLLINLNDSFLSSYIFKEDKTKLEEYSRICKFVESNLKLKEITKTRGKKSTPPTGTI